MLTIDIGEIVSKAFIIHSDVSSYLFNQNDLCAVFYFFLFNLGIQPRSYRSMRRAVRSRFILKAGTHATMNGSITTPPKLRPLVRMSNRKDGFKETPAGVRECLTIDHNFF